MELLANKDLNTRSSFGGIKKEGKNADYKQDLIVDQYSKSGKIIHSRNLKDWETIVFIDGNNKVCFAQSVPVLQAPKKNPRDARLFVSFRPNDKRTCPKDAFKSSKRKIFRNKRTFFYGLLAFIRRELIFYSSCF